MARAMSLLRSCPDIGIGIKRVKRACKVFGGLGTCLFKGLGPVRPMHRSLAGQIGQKDSQSRQREIAHRPFQLMRLPLHLIPGPAAQGLRQGRRLDRQTL